MTGRNSRGFFWFSLLLACLSSSSVIAEAPKNWQFLSFDDARKLAGQNQKRMFVYFGRFGCPTCARVNEKSLTDTRVIENFHKNYLLAYVDSESGERLRLPSGERITEMDLGIRYKVFGTPFFFFMEPDGTTIVRIPGFVSAEQFLALDQFVNGGYYKQQTLEAFVTDKS